LTEAAVLVRTTPIPAAACVSTRVIIVTSQAATRAPDDGKVRAVNNVTFVVRKNNGHAACVCGVYRPKVDVGVDGSIFCIARYVAILDFVSASL